MTRKPLASLHPSSTPGAEASTVSLGLEEAVRIHRAGDLEGAAALYREALEANPGNADALNLLGLTLHQRGDHDGAVARLRAAIRLAPRTAAFHANLGRALASAGALEQAAASLSTAAKLNPSDAAAHFHLGTALIDLGRPDDAVEYFRAVVRLRPDSPEHLVNLAHALRVAGRLEESAAAYRQALDRDPDNAECQGALGSVLQRLGQNDAALACYARALDLNARLTNAHLNAGDIQRDTGHPDEALRHYRAARAIEPEDETAITQEATLHERQGDFERACALILPLIDGGSRVPSTVLAFARLADRLERRGEAQSLLEKCLQRPGVSPHRRQLLHAALANLYDKAGAVDAAFRNTAAANGLTARRFDPLQHEALVDRLIDTLNASALRRLPRASHGSRLPVFIVGMPRSGTTLVEQILASHPRVFGAGELTDVQNLPATICDRLGVAIPYPEMLVDLDFGTADAVAQLYLDKLREMGGGAARITDKMPHNFLHLGLIALLFPEAAIIHCVRDAVDTCASCFFQNFGDRNPYTADLAHLGAYYVQYRRLMRHWQEALDRPILDVVYEDLVGDVEGTTRAMLNCCGLEWEVACLRFHENRRFVQSASHDQVRRPLYATSIGRSRRYLAHLAPLLAVLSEAGEIPRDLADVK